LNAVEIEKLADLKASIDTEMKVLLTGEEVLVHYRVYPLGTDSLGRDILARIIYGGQVSILIGLLGALTSVFIGVVLGSLSGYIGGTFDSLMMRFVDIMYSLPYMLLVIIFMAVFGRAIQNLFFALAIVSWLTVARVVRGQIMSLKNSEYVEAARSSGAGTARIVFRHLVPNTAGVIIVYTTLRVPSFIMLEAFLSFLGLGVQAPYASWGVLIQEGVYAMTTYPWMLWFPAAAMTLFLFSMNFLGDGLRDAMDPQSKNKL
ncbi:MAG: ABC transporter permease, partial [Spirochaetales bacterium]|nr:ABC transporter permease [Spirochaetales bacterium]